jgi:hypothetical protein
MALPARIKLPAQRNRRQTGSLKRAWSKNKRLNAQGRPSGQRRCGRSQDRKVRFGPVADVH